MLSLLLSFLLPNSDSSYFLLHTRAWELLLGGIVFFLPSSKFTALHVRLYELVALGIIFLNIAIVPPMQGWQPEMVLPGTFACAFLLWLNVEHSILSNKIFQYTGRISYSMYLIHWPVITICAKLGQLNYFVIILVFIVIYSALSYHFIETRRKWRWIAIIIYLMVIGVAQAESSNKGKTPFNNSVIGNQSYHEVFYGGRDIPEAGTTYSGKIQGSPSLVIAGDSFARQYANFFDTKVPFIGVFSDGQLHFENVFIVADVDEKYVTNSNLYYRNFIHTLRNTTVSKVLIAHNWGFYLDQNAKFTSKYASHIKYEDRTEAVKAGILWLADNFPDKQFFIVGQTIEDPFCLTDCVLLKHSQSSFIRSIFGNMPCHEVSTVSFDIPDRINKYLKQICLMRNNLHFIDPNPAVCQQKQCVLINKEGNLTFSDGKHLSLSGAQSVGALILKDIESIQP